MFETREKVNPAPAHDAFTPKEGAGSKRTLVTQEERHTVIRTPTITKTQPQFPLFCFFNTQRTTKTFFFTSYDDLLKTFS